MPIYILEPAGTHLNQYQIDNFGRIRAPAAALLKATVSDADIAAITAQFDLLMQLDVGANAYFDAKLIVDMGEPALIDGREDYDVFDDGLVNIIETKYHPAWQKYYDAQSVIDAASDDVKALHTVRVGVADSDDTTDFDAALITVLALNIQAVEQDQLRLYQEMLIEKIKVWLGPKGYLAALNIADSMVTDTVGDIRASTTQAAAAEVFAYAYMDAKEIEKTI